MPLTTVPDPRLDIDPVWIGAAIGITARTGADYQFTDAYGVTYTGAPAHVALSALARRDRIRGIYSQQPAVTSGIHGAAATLIDWFTSPHVDPQHAAEFAALPPMRVVELVVYLCLHGDAAALSQVGPESLPYYTDHLLHDPVPSPKYPLPRLIDQPYRSLAGSQLRHPRNRLQVTATARGGAKDVAVPMEIEATEETSWELTVAVPVPVDELNELLMDPDYLAGGYLSDNRELIDDHLDYANCKSDEDLDVTGRLAHPHDITLAEPLDRAPGTRPSRGRPVLRRTRPRRRAGHGAVRQPRPRRTVRRPRRPDLHCRHRGRRRRRACPDLTRTYTAPPSAPRSPGAEGGVVSRSNLKGGFRVHPEVAVLVATDRTQRHRANEFIACSSGELVDITSSCDRDRGNPDGGCGCCRAFTGLDSRKATTTAEVVRRPMSFADYVAAHHASLLRAGLPEDMVRGWAEEAARPHGPHRSGAESRNDSNKHRGAERRPGRGGAAALCPGHAPGSSRGNPPRRDPEPRPARSECAPPRPGRHHCPHGTDQPVWMAETEWRKRNHVEQHSR